MSVSGHVLGFCAARRIRVLIQKQSRKRTLSEVKTRLSQPSASHFGCIPANSYSEQRSNTSVFRETWPRMWLDDPRGAGLGLLVATAVMVQPGYRGTLTLELVNHGDAPIAIYPGSRIAQLAIRPVIEPPITPYSGKYVGPTGPQVSHLAKERAEVAALEDTAARFTAP